MPSESEEVAGTSSEECLRQAQELIAGHLEPGILLSEELIAERRAAAKEE